MAFFNDTYCQLCENLNTKEQWNKHFCSRRRLHREVNGYWPAYCPKIKLTRDEEGSILEKAFWEIIFGSVDALAVYGLLKTYFKMVTSSNGFVKDDDDDEHEFGYLHRDNMIPRFKQHLYLKKVLVIKIKINVMRVSKKELSFGLITLLLMREAQNQIMFMIMIGRILKWIFSQG